MHDITLTHHELAKVRSLEELKEKKGQFPEPEANAYSSHPELSAAMVKSMSSAPMDVDIIVRQHHERPDGSGFPNRLRNEQLHPLSVVFITAHELLNYLYEHPKDWNFNDFLETNELLNAEGSTFFKLRFILKEASVDIHLPEAA